MTLGKLGAIVMSPALPGTNSAALARLDFKGSFTPAACMKPMAVSGG